MLNQLLVIRNMIFGTRKTNNYIVHIYNKSKVYHLTSKTINCILLSEPNCYFKDVQPDIMCEQRFNDKYALHSYMMIDDDREITIYTNFDEIAFEYVIEYVQNRCLDIDALYELDYKMADKVSTIAVALDMYKFLDKLMEKEVPDDVIDKQYQFYKNALSMILTFCHLTLRQLGLDNSNDVEFESCIESINLLYEHNKKYIIHILKCCHYSKCTHFILHLMSVILYYFLLCIFGLRHNITFDTS